MVKLNNISNKELLQINIWLERKQDQVINPMIEEDFGKVM